MQQESRRLAYIAKDTKTYMNLEEARFKYSKDEDENILFILIPKNLRGNLTERMQETIKEKLWDDIVWVETWSNSVVDSEVSKKKKSDLYKLYWDVREYFYNYLDRRKLDSLAAKYSPCQLVFSAHKNTQEHLAAALNPAELILVDSGHRIFQRINNNGYIDYSRWHISYSRFTRYMFWGTGMKVFDRTKTTLFTVYADEIETNHHVEKNTFAYQSYLLSSKEIGENVVWISTPIYAMAKGVDIEDYIRYIQKYIDTLEIDPGKMIYVPHPGKQTDHEISFIRESLKCKIDDRDIPVEFKIANYDKLPGMCISPFSSALVNIDTASKGRIKIVSAWHYEFSYFEMWENWKKDVEKNPRLHVKFIEIKDCNPLFYIEDEARGESPKYETFSDWESKR
ncbi:MAG: hypothetical protein R3220_06735 [Balneolaceae bacterium]|nr:hypothetical protein [Balneolaceae bacterium]